MTTPPHIDPSAQLWLAATPVEPLRKEPCHESEMVDQVLGGMLAVQSGPLAAPSPEETWVPVVAPNGYQGWLRSWVLRTVAPDDPWCRSAGCAAGVLWTGAASAAGPRWFPMGMRCLKNGDRLRTPWNDEVRGGPGSWPSAAVPFAGGFYGPPERGSAATPGGVALYEILRRAAARAAAWIDIPYLWGGVTPGGVDCSGFVHLCLGLEGLLIPRDAGDQCRWFRERDWASPGPAEPGSSGLAFIGAAPDRITHAGFLTAGGMLLHASGRVLCESLDPDVNPRAARWRERTHWVVTPGSRPGNHASD
ncbi:MAG: hypothetical protein GF355_14425 [Candidatus Eisenbacteria bacterium]|nr:hypothetical protein [Candidatus Eisenbacteria bacterium]